MASSITPMTSDRRQRRQVTSAMTIMTTTAPPTAPPSTMEIEEMRREINRQYSNYRATPDEYPSYDILRFVRLPPECLPRGLLLPRGNTPPLASSANNNGNAALLLQYWPALVYRHYSSIVRDRPAGMSATLKAVLIIKHRKCKELQIAGKISVARLLAPWDATDDDDDDQQYHQGGNTNGREEEEEEEENEHVNNDNNNTTTSTSYKKYFPETKLRLLQLDDDDDDQNDNNYEHALPRTIDFVDGQLDIENACSRQLLLLGGGSSGGGEDEDVINYIRQLQFAIHMGLNCLAIDIGSDPMLISTPISSSSSSSILPSSTTRKKLTTTMMMTQDRVVTKTPELSNAVAAATTTTTTTRKRGVPTPTTDGAVAGKGRPINSNSSSNNKKKKKKKKYGDNALSSSNIDRRQWEGQDDGGDNGSSVIVGRPSSPTTNNIIIDPNGSWKEVWEGMRKHYGWTWKAGSGLMTDYYYVKPGRKIKGGTSGIDYYTCCEDVRNYAMMHYGWIGTTTMTREDNSSSSRTTAAAATDHDDGGRRRRVAKSNIKEEEEDDVTINELSSLFIEDTKTNKKDLENKNKKSNGRSNKDSKRLVENDISHKKTKGVGGNDAAVAFANGVAAAASDNNNDDDDAVESIVSQFSTVINQHQDEEEVDIIEWKDMWTRMKRHGWGWHGASGLMTDYYYIKPKCKIKGGIEGVHYFTRIEDTKQFARHYFGWNDNIAVSMSVRDEIYTRIEEYGKYSGERVPPLILNGVEVYQLLPDDIHKPWRGVWNILLNSGWTWKAGTGLMLDYYYIKPKSKAGKNGEAGQDYFVTLYDVQKFVTRNYGWRGEGSGIEVSAGPIAPAKATAHVTSIDVTTCDTAPGAVGRTSMSEKRRRAETCAVELAKMKNERAAVEKEEVTTKDIDLQMESSDGMNDADDSDDTESTYSQSGFRSKKLFLDECADENVPPLTCEIDPDEPWRDVWETMRKSGWTWKSGSGLMTDYYYIKPGCKVKGGMQGRDYFESEEDVRRFATRNYGWGNSSSSRIGGGIKRGCNSVSSPFTTTSCMSQVPIGVPEKKRKKVEVMPEVGTTSSSTVDTAAHCNQPHADPFDRKAAWQALQKEGWKAISAGRYNNLHDWYYVRPNCDPGDGKSELGVDYFLSEEDAIEFVKRSTTIFPSSISESNDALSLKLPSSLNSSRESITTSNGPLNTPPDCKTRPQDPGNPLLRSAESCSSSSRSDTYEWSTLWPLLETAGWYIVKAGKYNPLHDWYYVRPNRDPGVRSCILGTDYFSSEIDVIEFVKSLDEKDSVGTAFDVKSRRSMGMLEAFEAVAKDEMDNRDDVNEDITNDNVTSDSSGEAADPPSAMNKMKMLVGWM